MRWHYRDPLLVWLLPLSFAIHSVEEWIGGFPEWLALVGGSPLPRGAFVVITAIALITMVVAVHLTTQGEENGWMGIAVATVLLVNALLHVFGSLATGTYSPGLFTSIVLYLPLSQLALLRAWFQAGRGLFLRGTAVGLLAHVAVLALGHAMQR